jgi:glycosyltransferase involved in cell wall biosynthesis
MSITAAMIVCNEENRIEDTLRCVQWCDEIVVFDRMSTDATREIALRYSAKIIDVPNREFKPEDNFLVFQNITTEWILGLTASDLLTPGLTNQIRKLTNQKDFPYDVIHIPFRRYVLGLETKRSPWYCKTFPSVYRKSVARVNPHNVHGAVFFNSTRHFRMPNSTKDCLFHLTHENLNILMDRHINYWRAEANCYPVDKPLYKATRPILSSLNKIIFKNKTYLMGWSGIALALAYLSYAMLQFVFIWERKKNKAPQTYLEIKAKIKNSWLNEMPSKRYAKTD